MSTPVVTEKWAGQFDCSVCRRKRLMAEEFSKKVSALFASLGCCQYLVGTARASLLVNATTLTPYHYYLL